MPRTAKQEEAVDEPPFTDPAPSVEAPRPVAGYRVAGDLEVRSKELEQDLVTLRERYKALERSTTTGFHRRLRRDCTELN